MKRYIAVILLMFAFTSSVYGEEYESSFGFIVNIPEHWLVLTRQELKDNPDLLEFDAKEFGNLDKDLLKGVRSQIESGKIECYLNQATADVSFMDNINVMKAIGTIPENDNQLQEACDSIPKLLSSAFGRRIKVFQCKLKNVNGLDCLFLTYEGAVEGTTSLQYVIQKSRSVQIIMTATCKNATLKTIRDEFENIMYSIRLK